MKVALVHDFLTRYGGAEKVLQCFCEIFPNAKIHTLFYNEKNMGKFFPKDKIITSSLQKYYKLFFGKYTLLLSKMPQAIEEFDFSDYDLVLSSSSAFSHGIITGTSTKHISYVHSPMRWAWDYYFEFQKERKFGFIKKFLFSNKIHRLRIWDFIAKGRPDKIIAVSKLVQKRIKKYWQKESDIIYPFVDIDNFYPLSENNKIPSKNYYLVVSQLVSYKKIDQVIKSFNEFGEKLIIVGSGCEEKTLKKIAKENIEFVGAKYGKDILGYYQNAKAFIFAGIDDFGITAIESMACGVPVIAINKGAVRETVIKGETGFFYEDQNSESLLRCLKESNLENISSEDCINQAKKFSKNRFVKEIKKLTLEY